MLPARALTRTLHGGRGAASAASSEFREMVRDFAAREVAPHAEAVDKTNAFPTGVDLWKKMGDFGLHGEGCSNGARQGAPRGALTRPARCRPRVGR
jgi:alkylation response protein AidB-like acyl-CoA dehydrogenase